MQGWCVVGFFRVVEELMKGEWHERWPASGKVKFQLLGGEKYWKGNTEDPFELQQIAMKPKISEQVN